MLGQRDQWQHQQSDPSPSMPSNDTEGFKLPPEHPAKLPQPNWSSVNLLAECTNTSGLSGLLWHWPLRSGYVLCKEVPSLVSILWQTDSLSVPWLSCYKKIIISIYFIHAAQDIRVLNQMPFTHFLSHLNSNGLVILGDKAQVIWCYLTFYGDRESTVPNTKIYLHTGIMTFSGLACLLC